MSEQDATDHGIIFKRLEDMEKSVSRIQGGLIVCTVFAVVFCTWMGSHVTEIGNVSDSMISIKAMVRNIIDDRKKRDDIELMQYGDMKQLQEKVYKLEVRMEKK